MNKTLPLLLALGLGVGTYIWPPDAGAQEGPPPTTCTSDQDCLTQHPTTIEVTCYPTHNDTSCPNYEETTETSIFVCSPYPDPACFEGEGDEGLEGPPSEAPEEAQGATDLPEVGDDAPARTQLPRTGPTSTYLAFLGAGFLGLGTLTMRLRRHRMGA